MHIQLLKILCSDFFTKQLQNPNPTVAQVLFKFTKFLGEQIKKCIKDQC